MNQTDKEILNVMKEIPILKEPFAEVARKLGITQDDIIITLKKLMSDGIITRFGVSVNQREVGIVANAVVAWKVPKNLVEEVGEALSCLSEVTHCYERQTVPGKWEYNLFIVLHGYSHESVRQFVEKLSRDIGIKKYLVLFSDKQFKRTSITSLNKSIRGVKIF